MSVQELLTDLGSFDVQLEPATPWDVLTEVAEFGHLVVFDEWVDARAHSDAALLAAARYAGPVLALEFAGLEGIRITGAGMAWWLGDALNHGDLLTVVQNFEPENWQTVLAAILPDAITVGTLTDPAVTQFYGFAPYDTPLTALRMLAGQIGAEWRVNPDASLDMGPAEDVYLIDDVDVIAVVTRDDSGDDGRYVGIPTKSLRSRRDATPYITGIVLSQQTDYDPRYNVGDVHTTTDRASVPYVDLGGNAMVRRSQETRIVAPPGGAGPHAAEWSTMDDVLLGERGIRLSTSFLTDFWSFSHAKVATGDAVFVHDPPMLVDASRQIYYRGEVLTPAKLRVVEVSWPIRRGMGIYYRAGDGTWLDLSRFVVYEETSPVVVTLADQWADTPLGTYYLSAIG